MHGFIRLIAAQHGEHILGVAAAKSWPCCIAAISIYTPPAAGINDLEGDRGCSVCWDGADTCKQCYTLRDSLGIAWHKEERQIECWD